MRATTTNGARRTACFGRVAAAFGVTALAGFGLLPAMPATAASASPTPVTIQDFKFVPPSVTVFVGTTVQWTNDGSVAHTVTADNGSFSSDATDPNGIQPNGTFSFTFNQANTTYTYHCRIHPSMTGTIVVKADTTTTAAPTTTTTAAPTTTTTAQTTTTTAPAPSTTATSAPHPTTTSAPRATTTTRPAAPSTTRATAASTTTTAPPAPAPTDTTVAGAGTAVPAGPPPAPAGTTPSTEVANGVAAGPNSGGPGGDGGGPAAALGLGAAALVAVSGAGWWTLRRRRSAR